MGAERWAGLELRHLAALDAIVGEGSFRGAAERLGYVQSAVSQHLTRLEQAAGAQLVERPRGARTARLTPAGEVLSARAERILASLAAAKSDLSALQPALTDTVHAGATAPPAAALLPRTVAMLGRSRPDVAVRVLERAGGDELVSMLRAGRLDVAFGELPIGDAQVASVELLSVPWVLLVAPEAPLARAGAPVRLDAVAGLALIGRRSSRAYAQAEDRLAAAHAGDGLDTVLRTDALDRTLALVAARIGAALVPRLGVEDDPRVRMLELGGGLEPVRFGVMWHRERRLRPSARELVALAGQLCGADVDERLAAPDDDAALDARSRRGDHDRD